MSLKTTAYCDSCTEPIDNPYDLPDFQIISMKTASRLLDGYDQPLEERHDLLRHFCRECLDYDTPENKRYRLYVSEDGELLAIHRISGGTRGFTPPFDGSTPEDIWRIAELYRGYVRDDDD